MITSRVVEVGVVSELEHAGSDKEDTMLLVLYSGYFRDWTCFKLTLVSDFLCKLYTFLVLYFS